jgi:hypothetical protein
VWSARRIAWILVAAFLVNLAVGFVGAQLTAAIPPPSSHCPLSVASGITPAADACSGDLHAWQLCIPLTSYCWTIGDVNPADWLEWLACEITTTFIQALNTVLGEFLGIISGGLATAFGWLYGVLQSFITAVYTVVYEVAVLAGPLAPVAFAVILGAMTLAAVVLGYIAVTLAIAAGKTLFNLL